MLRRKLTESLTARVFLLTAAMLLLAGAITFGLIAWATPITYTAVVNDDLAQQVDALVQQLERVELADSGPLLDRFIRTSGADVLLLGPDGQAAETGSQLAVQSLSEGEVSCRVTVQDPPEGEQTAVSETDEVTVAEEGSMDSSFFTWSEGDSVAVTMSEQATVTAQVSFADQPESCSLYVTPHLQAQNLAVRALVQMAPWLLLTLLVFSLLCAFGYSRYITRPIVRLSGIAGRMAQLDFHWECGERRRDEIGAAGPQLGRDGAAAVRGAGRAGERQPSPAAGGGAAHGLFLRRLPRAENAGHHPQGPAFRDAGRGGHLQGPGQVSVALAAGHRPDGEI